MLGNFSRYFPPPKRRARHSPPSVNILVDDCCCACAMEHNEGHEATLHLAHAAPQTSVAVFASGAPGRRFLLFKPPGNDVDVRCALSVALRLRASAYHVTLLAPERYRMLAVTGPNASCSRFIAFPVDPMTFFWGEEAAAVTAKHAGRLLDDAYPRWVGRELHALCDAKATEMCAAAAQAVWFSSHFETPGVLPKCSAIVCCGIRAMQSIALALAESMHIPLISFSTIPEIPTAYFSHPLLPFQLPFVPRTWSYYLSDFLIGPIETPLFHRHRPQFGLPPLSSTVAHRIAKHPFCYTAGMWSSAMLPSPPDWTERVIAGPISPISLGDQDEIARLKSVLDEIGSQYVLAHLTSLPARIALMAAKKIAALLDNDEFVVLISSEDVTFSIESLQEWQNTYDANHRIRIVPVSHAFSLSQVQDLGERTALVHDGTPVSFFFALSNGIPSLPLSLFDDAHWWATRMHRKGISATPLTLSDLNDSRRLSRALNELRSMELRDAVASFRDALQVTNERSLDEQVCALLHHLHANPPRLPPLTRLQRIPPILTPVATIAAVIFVCYCYSKAAVVSSVSSVTLL